VNKKHRTDPVKFKVLDGPVPPPAHRRGERSKLLFEGLDRLKDGQAIEILDEDKSWRLHCIRWSRDRVCRVDCYLTPDGRKICVRIGGAPKPKRTVSASTLPAARPPGAPAPSGPRPPLGLRPEEINPNAKPHQGKKLRASNLL
jgi:hypothetical protein